MALKVTKARSPYAPLAAIEKQAAVELDTILGSIRDLVTREIMNSTPDGDEHALEGVLQKSVREDRLNQRFEQSLRDYTRRELHGAPNKPSQLSEDARKRLVSILPWSSGRLDFDPSELRETAEEVALKEQLVPVYTIVYGGFDSAELDLALQGKGEVPELLFQAGSRVYWCTKNPATVFAALVMNLPALVCDVRTATEVTPLAGSLVTVRDRREVEVLAQAVVSDQVYRLESYREPLAEQARKWDLEILRILLQGTKSEEEIESRAKADRRDDQRRQAWLVAFEEARAEGLDDDAANRAVREDERWIVKEQLCERQLELTIMVERRWEQRREEARQALSLVLVYASEDGLSPSLMPLLDFYAEAHKGVPPKPGTELTVGTLAGVYNEGEDVEILDRQGQWTSGVIKRVDGGLVKVQREDGQIRTLDDPTYIRHKGEGKLGLDNAEDPAYNKAMGQIRIEEFNVVIPAGSNSAKLEHALEPITAEMNAFPLIVNAETWKRNLDNQSRELETLNKAACDEAGEEFRPNSSKDCAKILFEKQGLPIQRVNKGSGEPSVDKETLQALESQGSMLAGKIIQAREARSKLSQLEAWEPYAKAGTVQCNWKQLGTPHGRYSCEDPNLQNRITSIRETIEAPKGYKLVSLDLGQAEYVCWASLSNDPTLSKAFLAGVDFHRQMYDEIHNAAPDVSLHNEPRQAGKTINFALLYLMQAFVLAKRLGITTPEALAIIDAYRARAPLAVQYIEDVLTQAQKTGMVSTRFGRTRYMPQLRKVKGPALHEARKTAWHHHNAGTAAEILKIKQVKVWNTLRREGFDADQARIALQMHDEIILQVRDDVLMPVTELALAKFKEVVPGFLPFKVDQRTGQNWLTISK